MHKKRADGRVKAAVAIGVKPDGTPIKKYVYARSERELKQKIEDIKLSQRTGTYVDPGRMKVAQLFDIWQQRHVSRKKPKTQEFYQHMIHHILPVLGGVQVKDLSPLHIEALLDQHRDRVSGTTLHQIYSTLRVCLNKAIRWRLIAGDNPCKGVDPPAKTTERCNPYDQDEVQRLLQYARDDFFCCLYLMAVLTGMREGELLALRWSDIDLNARWLQVERSLERTVDGEPVFGDPKTEESHRRIPLGPTVLQALREHKSRQQIELRLAAGTTWRDFDLVFTQRNGGPVNPSNLRNRHWYPLLKRAGLRRIRLHDLRHTAATVMLTDLGYDIKTVQEILGHAEARTTMNIYSHGRDDKKREAVSRLDEYLTAPAEKEHSS